MKATGGERVPAARFPLIRAAIEARPCVIGQRLILHAGSPKTGTTSLQVFLDAHREPLRRQGILYPRAGLGGMRDPKHQWFHHFIHPNLDEPRFARHFADALDEGDGETCAMLLSTEAIFNHWYDYGRDARDLLRMLGCYFDVACILWLREPVSFFRSYYVQCLKNPDDGQAYGRDLCPDELLGMERVRRRLRYDAFLADAERLFGAGRVYPFAYEGDTVAKLARILDVDVPRSGGNRNVSPVSALGVSMLRRVNRIGLTGREKGDVVRAIAEIDRIVGARAPRFDLDAGTVRRIGEICPMPAAVLAELDAASLDRWRARWPATRRQADPDQG